MFTRRIYVLILTIVLAAFALAACNLPSSEETQSPTQDPNLIYTAAAMTVQAQLTQSVAGTPVAPASQTPAPAQPTSTTVVVAPTSTTAVLPPTNTSVPPTKTSVPPTATVFVPCDRASFVSDVSFPDNSELAPGTTFVKTWRIRNNGSCTWTSSYALVFVSGAAMSGPASLQFINAGATVAPGSTVDVSVTLTAPATPDTYRGDWKLRNAAGATFGIGDNADKSFWVQIKVVSPKTPTPTVTPTPNVNVVFDFISRGPDAQWRNATTTLPWGDPPDDSAGVAVDLNNAKAENNKTYSRTLATYPQRITDGIITGQYPLYTVQNGDHFRATIGLRTGCEDGKVRYQLKYVDSGGEVLLGEWLEACDGKVVDIDLNLSGLTGKVVQFVLVVKAEGVADGDLALWISPRIER